MTRTIAARPQQAALGGDPSVVSHIRAFVNLKFYQAGSWEERLEVSVSDPYFHPLTTCEAYSGSAYLGQALLLGQNGAYRGSSCGSTSFRDPNLE